MIIQLKSPIKINGVEVSQLDVQEPDLEAIVKMETCKEGTAQARSLIASCCGIHDFEAGKLKMKDFKKIADYLQSFLELGVELSPTDK